jgi:hypothetical protein
MIGSEHQLIAHRMAEFQALAAAESRAHRFAVARRAARRAERAARRRASDF